MPLRSPSPVEIKKFGKLTLKVFGTLSIWIGTAVLARLHLAPAAKDWQATLSQLPLWSLLALLFALPFAWLLVEFSGRCFLEIRCRILEQTAPQCAQIVFDIPSAIKSVAIRHWDDLAALLSRWRFDGQYCKLIAEECQQLHSQTGLLHATASFSLEEAYTELNLASTQYGEIEENILSSRIRGRESIYGFLRSQTPGTALALLGRPGGGKTTLLRHLALLFSKHKQSAHRLRNKIPILIELRRVTELFTDPSKGRWRSPTLLQVVQFYWKQHSALGTLYPRAPKDWLKRHLASGRVLIMIDGLDEVPHVLDGQSSHKAQSPRQRVAQWVENEMQREGQRKCLFLVTSRPGGFAEAPIAHRTVVAEVQPLTADQSTRFIHSFQFVRLRHAHPAAKKSKIALEATRATEKLQQELRMKPHLAELQVNPLLLHMVCLLHFLRGRLPADRSDLYKETCDVLLNRDLRAPGFIERLRPEDKLAALQPLADYFIRSQSPEAKSTAELLPIIEPIFDTLNFPPDQFFSFISKDSGILQEVEEGRWDFAHKTFYEYLAAEFWRHSAPRDEELKLWVEQDWWRVTLLFFSAKSPDSPVIIAALEKKTPKAWSLAFECIGAGHRINSRSRDLAKEFFEKALSEPENEISFTPAAQALLDLRMREEKLAGSSGDLRRRVSLVTQAEYQLFLYSIAPNERLALTPPHWKSEFFSGNPSDPVLGVTPKQAIAFKSWASNTSDRTWELPTAPVSAEDISHGYWTVQDNGGDINNLRADIVDAVGQIDAAVLRWSTVEGLNLDRQYSWKNLLGSFQKNRTFNFPTYIFWTIRRFFSRRYRVGRSLLRPFDNGAAMLESLGFVLISLQRSIIVRARQARPSDEEIDYFEYFSLRSHYVPGQLVEIGSSFLIFLGLSESDEMRNLVFSAFRGFLKKNSRGSQRHKEFFSFCRELAMRLAEIDDYERLRALIAQEKGNLVSINKIKIALETFYENNSFSSAGRRAKLLSVAVGVLLTQESPIAHRRAWLRFGLVLSEILLSNPIAPKDTQISLSLNILKLLSARMEGEVEPWESIFLVR